MVTEFVVQVLAGVTILILASLFVVLRQRAKGVARARLLVALAVVVALVGAAWVAAFLIADPEDGGEPRPMALVVARIEGWGVDRRRGFFTPQGYLVAPAHALPVGKTVTVIWTVGGRDESGTASVAQLGGCGHDVALLEVGEGPRSALPIGDSAGLRPGDAVTRFVPNEPKSGTVVAVGAAREAGSDCTWLVTTQLNNSQDVYPGDAGAPVLDANGEVVAMIARNDVENRHTLSVPIEDIREDFPRAFEELAT